MIILVSDDYFCKYYKTKRGRLMFNDFKLSSGF